jgi:hypothetical protein
MAENRWPLPVQVGDEVAEEGARNAFGRVIGQRGPYLVIRRLGSTQVLERLPRQVWTFARYFDGARHTYPSEVTAKGERS